MPKTAKTVLFISKILAIAGIAIPASAQISSSTQSAANPPQRFDVLDEIQRIQRETVGLSDFRAEYKTGADETMANAASLSGSEPVLHAVTAPPSTVAAQRLRHQPPKAARKAFASGVKAQRKGRQTESLEYYSMAVRLDPSYVEARAELGVLYAVTGEVSKALEQFEKASELEPNSSMLHFNRAWALLLLGRAAEAEPEARRVLALNPKEADAQKLLRLTLLAEEGTHQ